MKSLVIFLLFVGLFMVSSGIYEQRLKDAMLDRKVEYRFVPRSYYDEQTGEGQDLSTMFNKMFENNDAMGYAPFQNATTDPKTPAVKP